MLKALILAAGKGTRMKSDLPKVLHTIEDKPLAKYVKDAAKAAGAKQICYVVGYQHEKVEQALAEEDVCFALQEEQLGTGHAVKCAADFIGQEGSVLILCGDTPLISGQTLEKLYAFHKESGNAVTALSAMMEQADGYGRIIRDADGNFVKSVEHKDATEQERASHEVNAGMYLFEAADLSGALSLLKNDNAQHEYYLPDTLMILMEQGKKADAYCLDDATQMMGVNTPEQLAQAAEILKEKAV